MDPISQLQQEVNILKRQVSEIIRLAQVTEINIENSTLTCESEGLIQADIPFFTFRAGEDQTYWLPSVGELGYLLSPSGNTGNAVFLPGIFYDTFPAADTNPAVAKRVYRDGQTETVDTEETQYTYQIGQDGTPKRVINTEKIEDSFGTPKRLIEKDKIEDSVGANISKIDGNETLLERGANKLTIDASGSTTETGTGTLKLKAGANELDVTPVLINLLGAHIFKGLTTLMTSMGPAFFSPAPTPPSAPAPPAGAAPDSDGNPTQVPETTKSDLSITAGTINFTIPSLTVTVTGTAGPYPIVATAATVAFPAQLTFTGNGITLVIPATPL